MQQPIFNAARERNNNLFFRSYKNDAGLFSFHSQLELYFVDEGEMEVWVSNNFKVLRAGELSVALSFEAHAYRTPVASRSSVLIIPQYMCEEFIAETKGQKPTNPFICNSDTVKIIKSHYEKIKSNSTNRIEKLGYINLILGIVMKEIFTENTVGIQESSLASKVLLYINENFKSGITPAQVALHFGYSQSYMSRYFKSCFQTTLGKYLTTLRLKNALMLLHENKHSTTFCALESGFASMRTFYRTFYQEFGCSPKEYFKIHT